MTDAFFTPATLDQGFVVAIHIAAQPGEGETMAALLKALVAPSMAEPGMKLFLPYRSPTDPLSFFIFELYEDEAAWAAHQRTPHFLAALPGLQRAARRERVPFIPYAAVSNPE